MDVCDLLALWSDSVIIPAWAQEHFIIYYL